MATFRSWLGEQESRPDETGQLARMWRDDKEHGKMASPASMARWVQEHWDDGPRWANVIDLAVQERWAAENGQAGKTPAIPAPGELDMIRNDLRRIRGTLDAVLRILQAGMPEAATAAMVDLDGQGSLDGQPDVPLPEWAEPAWQELADMADFAAVGPEGDDHG